MLNVNLSEKDIYITRNVIGIFKKFRQTETQNVEQGGILLGQINNNSDQVLICRASIPPKNEIVERHQFIRDKSKAQNIIDYEFHNSDGMNCYLGEWHTHPSNGVAPSNRDVSMIKKQYHTNVIRSEFLFLIIVGLNDLYIGLYDGSELISKTKRGFFTNRYTNRV